MKKMFVKVAIVFFTFNLAVGYSEIVVEEETVSTVNGQPVPGDSSVQTNNPSGDMSATQKPNPPVPAPGGGGSAGEPPNGGFTCTSAPTEVESSTGSCGCCGSCPSCSFLAGLYCVENGGGGVSCECRFNCDGVHWHWAGAGSGPACLGCNTPTKPCGPANEHQVLNCQTDDCGY